MNKIVIAKAKLVVGTHKYNLKNILQLYTASNPLFQLGRVEICNHNVSWPSLFIRIVSRDVA